MKYKTTRKEIVNGCANVKYAGYCDLSYLLKNYSPVAYTCGVYGWNFDVYQVYGLTICTGYRNMPGKRLKHCSEYNTAAREICSDYSMDSAERYDKIEKLLKTFCELNK